MKNKKKIITIGIPIFLSLVGGVFALGGYFGGGGKIPGDTFTRGLVGYWNLDEGLGGVAYDASNYANNGVLTGAPFWGGSTTTCKIAGCLTFDGDNDYVDFGKPASFDITSVTAEAWIKTSDAQGVIIGKRDAGAYNGWTLWVNGNNAVWVTSRSSPDNSEHQLSSNTAVNDEEWHHLVGTYDGAFTRIYVDGVEKNSVARTQGLDVANQNVIMGSDVINRNRFWFNGLIDEVRVYNRALSAEEVRYHYNRGAPVAHWKFDEGEGRTAYDSTDNNNDGTLVLAGSATSSAWTAGRHGGALSFDGVDDYVDAGNVSANARTISFWLKRGDTSDRDVIDLGTPEIIISGNAVSSSGLTSPTYYVDGVKAAAIADTNWHHVVITDTADINANNVDIGKTDSSYFLGLIDDVRIYNYTRTPEEIRLDYNAGFGARFGPLSGCDQDPGSCMTQGLVGYWDFEEGSGNMAYDQSDYTNHGTTSGDPQWTKGKVGGALQFDGSDDYVDVGDIDAIDGATALTVSAWVKVDDLTNDGVIIAKDIFDVGAQLLFWRDEVGVVSGRTDIFSIIVSDGTNDARVESASNASSDNNWRYVTITFTAGSVNGLRFYIDGKEDPNSPVSTASISALKSTINSLQIGKPITTANKEFTGLIDEVRIYNRALSAEEIRYHYNRGGPVAHWKFDEGEGRTAYDSTDNNNDGTLVLAGSATSSAWTAGRHGGALSFDGVDDYVDAGNVSANARTISFWLKRGDTSDRDVIDLGTPEIIISGNAVSSSGLTSPTYYVDGVKAAAIADTNWHHVVVTDTADISANNVDIGKTDSSYFLGLIDDVRIYNYTRTPEEIRLDYNAGFGARFGPLSGCDQDPGSCMTQGLVGYWDFEEGSGSIVSDKSGNDNIGTLTTGATTTGWGAGVVPLSGGKSGGGAYEFDGVDDYVDMSDPADGSLDFTTPTFTIEAWVKPAAVHYGAIVTKRQNTGDNNGYSIYTVDSSSKFYVEHYDDLYTPGTYFTSVSTYSADQWYHIVQTNDASANVARLYINGVLENSDTTPVDGSVANTRSFKIGQFNDGTRSFNGLIDEVRIYNRALSAEEIRYHYNRGGPVAHWKFDEGEGRTAYDSTDNNNDGTLVLAGSATSSAWTAGRHGGALSFDGVDDYVDAGNVSANARTISFWLKRGDTSDRDVIDLGTPEIIISGNAVSSSGLTSPTYYVDGVKAAAIADTNWHHVVITDTADINANNVDIGKTDSSYFLGLIDDVRIYNYTRTPEQIRLDYNQGLSTHFR